MKTHFDLLRATRRNLLAIAQSFSLEDLNEIPAHFNNNIIWNIGHVVVTQQLLCYSLSGLKPHVSAELIDRYRKGTKPANPVGPDEWDYIKELMYSLIDQMEQDYADGLFKEYKEYKTSYGITLQSIEDAIVFNNMHESMHLGSVLALKRCVV